MSDNVLQTFLNMDKERQLLQSFLRIGLNSERESSEELTNGKPDAAHRSSQKSRYRPTATSRRRTVNFRENDRSVVKRTLKLNNIESQLRAARKKTEDQQLKAKKKPKENFIDFYTDKDRAASVSAGIFDIKESLQIKQKQDRSESLLIADEADINSVIALGLKEIKNANPEIALQFFSQALELNSTDINALVSRSKCYLLLGEPSKALQDAEHALAEEKDNIRAIYQKAESLYYLGQFEQSLMFFYRGLRVRPELASFRLGVQKNQEAIENTIGQKPRKSLCTFRKKLGDDSTPQSQQSSTRYNTRPKPTTKADRERRNTRKLLGTLCVDKEYLENLLKHPDLMRADTKTENISVYAKEAVDFLNKRQEFWRQQRPCTALPNYKNLSQDTLPHWF